MAKGIIFQPQSSSPLGANRGLWFNSTNDLVVENGASSVNVTQSIADLQSGVGTKVISKTYYNSTGLTIAKFTPVYSPTAGNIAPAYGSNETVAKVIGITSEDIDPSTTGLVAIAGYLEDMPGYTHNSYLYLSNVPGVMTETKPTIGSYDPGFVVFIVGMVEGTNFIIQPNFVGEL